MTVEPVSAVPFTRGVVELDGEAGIVDVTVGVAVARAACG